MQAMTKTPSAPVMSKNPKQDKPVNEGAHVGPTGGMHKGDRARQQAPEYARHARVSSKDNSKKATNYYID